jgi:hypothetical protein
MRAAADRRSKESEFFLTSPPVHSLPVVALPRNLLVSIDAMAVVRGQAGEESRGEMP